MVKKLIGVVAVVVLVLVGVGVWYFVIRDDSVDKAEVGCDPAPCEVDTTAADDSGPSEAPASEDAAAESWTVVPAESDGTIVISETIGGVADHQVEGSTGEITGSVELDGTEVTAAELTVDLTGLEFTDAPPGFDVANRARAMERTGLETAEFPEATFVLDEPIDLGEGLTSGEVVTADATGDLTIHGVTNRVTFEVSVVANGDTFEVTPTEFIPIALADYEMEVDAPGFVADIADEGSFDFLLVLEQA